jgi:hypothetical protein
MWLGPHSSHVIISWWISPFGVKIFTRVRDVEPNHLCTDWEFFDDGGDGVLTFHPMARINPGSGGHFFTGIPIRPRASWSGRTVLRTLLCLALSMGWDVRNRSYWRYTSRAGWFRRRFAWPPLILKEAMRFIFPPFLNHWSLNPKVFVAVLHPNGTPERKSA